MFKYRIATKKEVERFAKLFGYSKKQTKKLMEPANPFANQLADRIWLELQFGIETVEWNGKGFLGYKNNKA